MLQLRTTCAFHRMLSDRRVEPEEREHADSQQWLLGQNSSACLIDTNRLASLAGTHRFYSYSYSSSSTPVPQQHKAPGSDRTSSRKPSHTTADVSEAHTPWRDQDSGSGALAAAAASRSTVGTAQPPRAASACLLHSPCARQTPSSPSSSCSLTSSAPSGSFDSQSCASGALSSSEAVATASSSSSSCSSRSCSSQPDGSSSPCEGGATACGARLVAQLLAPLGLHATTSSAGSSLTAASAALPPPAGLTPSLFPSSTPLDSRSSSSSSSATTSDNCPSFEDLRSRSSDSGPSGSSISFRGHDAALLASGGFFCSSGTTTASGGSTMSSPRPSAGTFLADESGCAALLPSGLLPRPPRRPTCLGAAAPAAAPRASPVVPPAPLALPKYRRCTSSALPATAASSGSSSDDEASGQEKEGGEQRASTARTASAAVASGKLRRNGSWNQGFTPCSLPSPLGLDDIASGGPHRFASMPEGTTPCMRLRSSYHLTGGHAAVELFLRLNHARQTLDFVKRQAASFAALGKAELDVWEALDLVSELREYEAALMGGHDAAPSEMGLVEHAFQTAELCRLAHPQLDWLHLVGLLHGLGKLLAHPKWGSQPQWAVCGETFPVGCRFAPQVGGSEFFIASPDRRRRQLNTPCGMYSEHCGLTNVYMSWGGAEYLYLVLALNDTTLPPEALFLIRHQKFRTLLMADSKAPWAAPPSCGGAGCGGGSTGGGGGSAGGGAGECAYAHLLSADDRRMLPLLAEFQKLAEYRDLRPLPAGALQGAERRAYYDGLVKKYLGPGKLSW